MTMKCYEPWKIMNELNQLWNEGGLSETSNWHPAVDICEQGDQFVICADLPGIDQKDIEISFKDNILSVRGERHCETKSEEGKCKRIERRYGSFERHFTLPDIADEEKIVAKMDKGVLSILIPKRESVKPRKIEVL